MYDIDELFDKRAAIGSKLEDILLKQGITKAKFCANAGVSRPTLDKLLSGNITNKVNFINHMEKVLRCLSMTPDMLMGNIQNPYIKAKSLRNALRIKINEICNTTGISPERLREIESGADATMAELRDIALCLGVGVKSIRGENIFIPQVSMLADIIQLSDGENENNVSGFWGHIGIRPSHSKEYLWYPITKSTRSLVYRMQNKERMVVPCMDNKLLYLNIRNVNSIVLLDDACDSPGFANWDSSVNCGEIPQVVYESLEDYFYYADSGIIPDSDKFSPKFIMVMKQIIGDKKWNDDMIGEIIDIITIHYTDGEVVKTFIDFNSSEQISGEVEMIYNFEEYVSGERFLVYTDFNGAEIMINTDNVSIIELPLAQVEVAISNFNDEIMEI